MTGLSAEVQIEHHLGEEMSSEHGVVVGAGLAEITYVLEFSHTTISGVSREWIEKEKTPSERQFSGPMSNWNMTVHCT